MPHCDQLFCAFAFSGPIKTLVHQFKYQNNWFLAKPLARMMAEQARDLSLGGYDLITHVPSHKIKLKERGYSPAGLLAQELAKHFKIDYVDDIIYADRYRPSQTALNKEARAKNIKDTFSVKRHIQGKNILIVDDTFTTGATLSECCRVLKENGAGKIWALTLAKVRYEDIT